MARRKKRFGAVTGRKPGKPSRRWRTFDVKVSVLREPGARADPRAAYRAEACIKAGVMKDGTHRAQRCVERTGSTVTGAVKNAIVSMANKLK